MQTDGYAGYNALREKSGISSLGCWTHCRRKFVEANKVSGKATSRLANKALVLIAKLYQIERKAKTLSSTERAALREKESKPIVSQFHDWLVEHHHKVLPKSKLGEAFTYALNQWPYLQACFEHGEAEIDNNLVENLMWPFALGRRNWLFVGNERGGQAAALLYSFIQTCRLNDVNARQWFNYVLDKAHLIRRNEVDLTSLLPQFIDKDLLI